MLTAVHQTVESLSYANSFTMNYTMLGLQTQNVTIHNVSMCDNIYHILPYARTDALYKTLTLVRT